MYINIAPSVVDNNNSNIKVYLAGKIYNCRDWQADCISKLKTFKYDASAPIVINNPRRLDLKTIMTDIAYEQAEWEFNNINTADIFSIYFVDSGSDQLNCFYEFGIGLNVIKSKFPKDYMDRLIISIEPGFTEKAYVKMQSEIALNGYKAACVRTPEEHAIEIYNSYTKVSNTCKSKAKIQPVSTYEELLKRSKPANSATYNIYKKLHR